MDTHQSNNARNAPVSKSAIQRGKTATGVADAVFPLRQITYLLTFEELEVIMRLENIQSATKKEKDIRRRVHAQAILKDITMREAIFQALELWALKNEKR